MKNNIASYILQLFDALDTDIRSELIEEMKRRMICPQLRSGDVIHHTIDLDGSNTQALQVALDTPVVGGVVKDSSVTDRKGIWAWKVNGLRSWANKRSPEDMKMSCFTGGFVAIGTDGKMTYDRNGDGNLTALDAEDFVLVGMRRQDLPRIIMKVSPKTASTDYVLNTNAGPKLLPTAQLVGSFADRAECFSRLRELITEKVASV